MIKEIIIKHWKTVFNIQIIVFVLFITLTFAYYWNKPAHQYFNRNIEEITIQSVFALIMTYLFIAFIAVTIIYPLLYVVQILSLRSQIEMFKKSKMKFIILFVFYLLTIASVFCLLMINNSHSIHK